MIKKSSILKESFSLAEVRLELRQYEDPARSIQTRKFFKNSQECIFLGITAALVRKVAKEFWHLSLDGVRELMRSDVHDERSLAHQILCIKFRKATEREQEKIYNFYIENKTFIRDWDGVDDTAPYIVGAYLLNREKQILYELATSSRIWDRRIAIVSTWWFIRQGHIVDTIRLAKLLLKDKEDLIHKATGWMLREMGKRDLLALKEFLNSYSSIMPRTMLRYAIERFSPDERQYYLTKKEKSK